MRSTAYSLRSRLLLGCAIVVARVVGQTVQMVQVGLEGSFFDPASLIAQVNDTITFVFSGDIHTVTQSTFENPCVPLPGGFNSGLAGKGANGSTPAPTWDLHITNTSQPIWFFCEATRPNSHCAAGMVGVINPPNPTAIAQFMSAAKAVSGTPAPTPTVVLTGQGAFATNSPVAPSAAVPAAPSSSSSTQSSSTAVATSTPTQSAHSSTNVAAIAGGVAAGAVVIIVILILAFWSCWRRKFHHTRDSRYTFASHARSMSTPKAEGLGFKAQQESTPLQNSYTPPATGFFDRTMAEEQSSPPAQWPISFPARPHQHIIDRQSSFTSSNGTQPPAHTVTQRPSNVDIHSLANEVAAVLLRAPTVNASRSDADSVISQPPQTIVSNPNLSSSQRNLSARPLPAEPRTNTRPDSEDDLYSSSPPPNYRSAMSSIPEK